MLTLFLWQKIRTHICAFMTCLLCVIQLLAVHPVTAQTVRLCAVGDIMLAGEIERLMTKKGLLYPFARMQPVLKGADVTFGNLECCLSTQGKPIPKQFNFRADPSEAVVLKQAGFTIVSCANNHAWDYGRDALLETVQDVERTGVVVVGAGANRAAAHRLRVITKNGLKIGFLAYLGLIPALVAESETEPCLSMASVESIRREVASAHDRVDVLIVSLHAGQEGAPSATPRQRLFAQTAIDAGADMVIGHHPHVVQPMEMYHGKPIFYSLGNFVFSVSGRGSGAMIDATLTRHSVHAKMIRLVLTDNAQPHLPESKHSRQPTRKGFRSQSPLSVREGGLRNSRRRLQPHVSEEF